MSDKKKPSAYELFEAGKSDTPEFREAVLKARVKRSAERVAKGLAPYSPYALSPVSLRAPLVEEKTK